MLTIYNGDGFKLMDKMHANKERVQLVVIDPPYGMVGPAWDCAFDMATMWKKIHNVLDDDGLIVVFGTEPFSTKVRMSNIKHYKYDWYWLKSNVSGFAFCKYQPLRRVENIMVFRKYKTATYNPQGLIELPKVETRQNKRGVGSKSIYNVDSLNSEYTSKYTNYPKNTLEFKVERTGLHPTQKPVALLEYLINTYTKEGDKVLDFCMGSGTCGVAAHNTHREFVGCELDPAFFNVAYERLASLQDGNVTVGEI